jgi:pullulanase
MWATVYKIDAFRFDLMGHHMRDDMMALQDAAAQPDNWPSTA